VNSSDYLSLRTQAYPRQLGLLAGAIIFTALNLRTAIASVPPLLGEIRDDVPLSATAAGVLTTMPVICMAIGSPIAPPLARRIGTEAAITALSFTVAAGILLRLIDGVVPLFAGTIVAGLGIALGNVLVPSLIKRDFPHRVGPMTGGYTMAISTSGAIAAALTIPFEDAIGRGWQWGLVVWAIPAVAAGLIWIPWISRHDPASVAAIPQSLWRNRLAWQVTVYMGLQSLLFYSALSWLPTLLRDHGIDREAAGALLSVMLLAGVPTCLLVPVFAVRGRNQQPAVAAMVALAALGLAGLLAAPEAAPALWAVLLGCSQGGLLALAFLFFSLRTPDQAHAAELSAMAQSVGYLLAAAGPLIVGVLRDTTGGWTAPLVFLVVVLVPLLAAGFAAARSQIV
jgi:MFS transporter, CP family, cyanate transporter